MKYHFYKIGIPGKYLYRLLNVSDDMTLRNIEHQEENVFFEIQGKTYEKLCNILEVNQIPCLKKEEHGLKKHLKYMKVKIIVIALVMCLGILKWNALFVWEISVEGNYSYTKQQITDFLKQHHYVEGILKKEISCDKIENLIRNHFTEISWVSCEMKGTNLIVHMKENYIAEISQEEKRPYHLVSQTNGIVKSIVVRNGTAQVKQGEKIKKGDLLISGKVEIYDESQQKIGEKTCCADGEIKVRAVHKYEDSVMEKQWVGNRERSYRMYVPSVGGYFFQMGENHYKEIDEQKLHFFGNYYLPISIKCYRVYKDQPREQIISKEDAEKILHHKMLYHFAQLEQKGYKILTKDVKIIKTASTYLMKGKYTCIEPVGKIQYIKEETNKKEGKSDERN